MKRNLIVIALIVFLASCATHQVGLEKHTGFTELPFPSNSFASGQIVEIYSSPRKVEITHQPDIPWDQAHISEGWDISNTETNTLRSTLATKISKVLKGKYEFASTEKVTVEFTNTKTRIVQKSTIYSAVKKELKINKDLKEMIADFMEDGRHYDVITTTLSANVTFSLVDSTNNEVEIDSEVLEKINSSFDIDFKKDSSSNKVITASNLVVGIHTDPKLIKIIMKKI